MSEGKACTPSTALFDTQQALHVSHPNADRLFAPVFGGLFVVVVILLGLLTKEPGDTAATQTDVDTHYYLFEHVSIMIFIGFGFLMTFLKRYSFSAVGYNMFLSVFVYLWNMSAASFWEQVHAKDDLHRLPISLPLMIEGLFGAGAVMISFGAVLGRTLPSQLLVLAFLEIIFYSFNFFLGALELKATDAGGSMFIHLFGAAFGVSASFFLAPPGGATTEHPRNSSRYTSDVTAMIGTLFLFIFWPSFNGALTSGAGQLRAVLNTTLSLAGSTMAAFVASHALSHKKFDMVHIQNATIAGGVAMGTSANLALNPSVAVLVGFFAGLVSTLGYRFVSPLLARYLRIADTCGVWNLHGMPGIIGAVTGIIAVASIEKDSYPNSGGAIVRKDDRDTDDQAVTQLLTLLITLGIAIVGGLITGFIVSRMPGPDFHEAGYSDHTLWEVPDDFTVAGVGSGRDPHSEARLSARNRANAGRSVLVSPSVVKTELPADASQAAAV